MRYIFSTFAICLFFTIQLGAQIYDPVKWNTRSEKVSEDEYNLIFEATIDDGWSIYSQYLESDEGPIKTSFEYEAGDHFSLVGKNEESGNKKETYDKIFGMTLIKFSKKAIFTQRIKVKDASKNVTGFLEFMTCDATKCLPPDQVDFDIKLVAGKAADDRSGNVEKVEDAAEKVVESSPELPEKVADKLDANKFPEEIKADKLVETIEEAKVEEMTKAETVTVDEPTNDSGILEPVKWQVKVEKKDDQTYELTYDATVEKGWYIYSQFLEGDDGPIPTAFYLSENPAVSQVGKVTESGPKKVKEFDKNFDMELIKFKQGASFVQTIKVEPGTQFVKGEFEYMSCDATRCLPPALVPFSADLQKLIVIHGDDAMDDVVNQSTTNTDNSTASIAAVGEYNIPKPDLKNPVTTCDGSLPAEEESDSNLTIFFLGLIGGFLALLTPCVFPMIPLTVSFFTKSSGSKGKGIFNAALYGFFILLVYLLLSLPFHLMDNINPDILNEISTNVWLNLFFFVIFLFFAFSFFGYYELTLPASWTNKASSAEGVGGYLGTFFMALTLALVSFSCTGPILGSLLATSLSSDGGAMQLTAGMAGFGVALALPFGLFAAFPSWLNSLPKSGGWLNVVKVVLGFIELGLAFKFLSNADLVKHWGLLKIEPFLIIQVVIFLGLALYLFGKIKFPHDSPIKKLGIPRIALGALSLAFAIYLASGFRFNEETQTFRPLTLLSGLAPPVGYSWIHPKECPNNLDCFKDLERGLTHARETGKPVLIDFTGYACVNCRKMEEHVWPLSQVNKYLKDDYVLISLYVDDRKELPEAEQVVVEKKTGGKRKLRTYGNKWTHFQTEYFNNNSQPYYVLMSPDGKLLNKPVPYTPDADDYASFLECGLRAYEKIQQEQLLGQK